MKFETEYKDEIQRISPTEEQCERIRNGVMSRLAEEQPAPKRKPLKIKIAAISTASACAAAVLIIALGSPSFTRSMFDHSNEALAPTDGNGASGDNAFADTPNYAPSDMQSAGISKPSADTVSPSSAVVGSSSSKTDSNPTTDTGLPGTEASGNPSVGDNDPDTPYLNFSENESRCTVTINGERLTYRASEPDDYTYDENQIQAEIAGLGAEKQESPPTGTAGNEGTTPPENPPTGTAGVPGTDTPEPPPTGGMGRERSVQPAGSNLDIELFVQFDEDKMLVFTQNGKLYKFFSLI